MNMVPTIELAIYYDTILDYIYYPQRHRSKVEYYDIQSIAKAIHNGETTLFIAHEESAFLKSLLAIGRDDWYRQSRKTEPYAKEADHKWSDGLYIPIVGQQEPIHLSIDLCKSYKNEIKEMTDKLYVISISKAQDTRLGFVSSKDISQRLSVGAV